MAFNIGNIRRAAELLNLGPTKEPQRAYMFEASIIDANDHSNNADLRFFVKSMNIPMKSKENIVIDYMDQKLLFAGKDASTHTVSISYWDDESLKVFRYFDAWMQQLGDREAHRAVDKDRYSKLLRIKMKDTSDFLETAVIDLTNVYPIEMSDISLSYEGSEVMEMTVTLSFDDRIVNHDVEFVSDLKEFVKGLL